MFHCSASISAAPRGTFQAKTINTVSRRVDKNRQVMVFVRTVVVLEKSSTLRVWNAVRRQKFVWKHYKKQKFILGIECTWGQNKCQAKTRGQTPVTGRLHKIGLRWHLKCYNEHAVSQMHMICLDGICRNLRALRLCFDSVRVAPRCAAACEKSDCRAKTRGGPKKRGLCRHPQFFVGQGVP